MTTLRRLVCPAAIALAAASCGDPASSTVSTPTTTGVVETTPAGTAPGPETTPAVATTTSTTPVVPTTTATPTRSQSIWGIPSGIEVAVAGTDGLHLLTGSDDRIISPDVFDDVVADPTGDGWLVMKYPDYEDQTAPVPPIRRIKNDGTDEVVLAAEPGTYLQLHDAGLVDGRPTMFYNVNLIRSGAGQFEILDELYSIDLDSGERHKITDVGGWETGVNLTYGGGILAGIWSSEATVRPWSVDLDGNLDPIDVAQIGLQEIYSDEPDAPTSLAISADGTRLSWQTWTSIEGQDFPPHFVITNTDGSNRREFTLPGGPASIYEHVDRGGYLVAGSRFVAPGALIDAETGGMLVLPVPGPVAAAGQWDQPPGWAIATAIAEDVVEDVRELEPQWAAGPKPLEEALAQALLGDDGGGECASVARSFPDYRGGGPVYIELRQFCDDSVAGALYTVAILESSQPNGSVTGAAERRTLCWRGVTTDGLCV